MLNHFVTFTFIVAGLVHCLPVLAVVSRARVEAMYGVAVAGPELELLLRHRALLFAVVAALLFAAAARREFRILAAALGLFSMLGYVVLMRLIGAEGAPLERVMRVDLVASALLALGVFLNTFGGQDSGD